MKCSNVPNNNIKAPIKYVKQKIKNKYQNEV